jgi:hypothetical protein
MKTVRIEVTQDDIDNGSACDVCACPIALACLRAGLKDVSVCDASLDWKEKIPTPTVAVEFIFAFDSGRDVKPFSFEIEVAE